MVMRAPLAMLLAVMTFGTQLQAATIDAARAGSENRSFTKAMTDSACESADQKIARIDRALEAEPYGQNAERLRRARTALKERTQALNCNKALR